MYNLVHVYEISVTDMSYETVAQKNHCLVLEGRLMW